MSGDDSSNLTLSVSIGDVSVEASGPSAEAERWFGKLQEEYLDGIDNETVQEAASTSQNSPSYQKPGQKSTDGSSSKNQSSGKSRSLAEYYRNTDGLNKKERALLVGWFLEKKTGMSDFTQQDIKSKAKEAKIDLGKNLSRDVRNQIGDGHIQVADEQNGSDTYQLTLTGEEYVEEELLNEN